MSSLLATSDNMGLQTLPLLFFLHVSCQAQAQPQDRLICLASSCLPGRQAAESCRTHRTQAQPADIWKLTHSLHAALLQSQGRAGPPQRAPGPVQPSQHQPQQRQGPSRACEV